MNLEFTSDEQAFRDEMRTFIEQNYPKHLTGLGGREVSQTGKYGSLAQDPGQERLVGSRLI